MREQLSRRGLAHLCEDAEIVTAALVDNAVRNGLATAPHLLLPGPQPQMLRLCLLHRIGEVMIAVTDPSDQAPLLKTPSIEAESDDSLQVVGALSYVWGWSPIEGHGRAVWAVLK